MKKEKEEKVKYGTISLPLPLIEKIKKKMEGTGMSSVSAYVSFVLRQVLSGPNPSSNEEILSGEDEKLIRERLKRLGYL